MGTSGWNYTGWRGVFYPAGLSSAKWLSYFAQNFDTAEVNYSFYHLPGVATYENWYNRTPPRFVFALKASRFITHIKRLEGVEEAWNTFVERASTLKEKLGPILLQFASSFRATPETLDRLARFLCYASSAGRLRLAIEFRHASWFDAPVIDLLTQHQSKDLTTPLSPV
jgi:uncharacterized protein YecE (DUF72 family)